MANDFLRLSCPYCGGMLSPDGELYRCGDCGNRFEKKKTETDSEKIRSILDEMKAEQVANIRRRLWEETHKEYISSDAILDAAQKILDILPEDRFANFYKAAVSEGYEELNRFLDNFDVSNTDDLPLILDFSIKVMEELNINSVKALAERGLTGEAKIDCYSKIEAEAEKIQSGIYNTDVPRTVFLAYSSKDMKKVNEVAAYLESQGFSCFVALRNLRHGKGAKENYQAEIMNAIANCKCVVFISSENSRAMTCDAMRIEIPFLRKTYPDKPHIEFLLDDYGKGTMPAAKAMLKEYFKDLEFCTNLDDLGLRVFHAEADVNTGASTIPKQQEEMMKKLQELEKKTSNQSSSDGVEPMIKRAEAMLTEGDFEGAANVADRILDRDFECAKAYLVKLLAECRVRCLADLGKVCTPLEVNKNYQKALQFADAELAKTLRGYNETIKTRIEEKRKETTYQNLISSMRSAKTKKNYAELVASFQKMKGYKDCDELLRSCEAKIAEIEAREEAEREAARQAEELRRAEEEARKKKAKKIASIVIPSVCGIIIAFFIWLFWPNRMTFTLNGDQESYTLSRIHNCTDQVIIPEKHNGKPVTSIGSFAFDGCRSLTSITIPSSVTSIGDRAFSYCSSLTSITIPSSVTSIGGVAFDDCSNLKAVYISDLAAWCGIEFASYSSNPLDYAHNLYINGELATDITIPEGVTSIGDYAFRGCSSLTSITIPSSVKNIGNDAFYDCSNLATVTFAENSQCSSIGICAFFYCSSLTSITIPSSVTSIGSSAFSGCSSLTSITVDSANKVYHSAGNCLIETGTKTLIAGCKASVIPDDGTVTIIGDYAFFRCSSLTSITIPSSVTSIGDWTFSGCSGLISITIPSSVTSIGNNAFKDCYKLIEVCNKSSLNITAGSSDNGYIGYYAKHIITDEKDSYLSEKDGYIFYDDGTEAYLRGYNGSATELILPEKTPNGKDYAIYQYAFSGCSSLTSITIPSSVKSIGEDAFRDCSNLATVTFAEDSQCSSIGEYAFYYCSSLTSITIPSSVTSIGSSAFYGCSKLIEICNKSSLNITAGSSDNGRIGYNAKHIITDEKDSYLSEKDGYIFYDDGTEAYLMGYNGSATELILPEKTPNGNDYAIYQYAFDGCSGLTSITIPSGVKNIGYYAFYDCSNLATVTFAENSQCSSIGSVAFCDCSSLTSITIPSSVKNIGSFAFRYCSNLKTVTFAENSQCSSIGNYAFWDCSSLESITIPSGATSIGDEAFYNCRSLTSITIPSSVTSIGSSAFSLCSSLTSITIPSSVTSIGDWTFFECSSLTSITFQGTKAQWNAISKGSDWNSDTGSYTIHCTDGDLKK